MQNSKTKMLGQLYRKDLRELRPEIIFIVAATIIINTWVYMASNTNQKAAVVIPLIISLGLAGLLPLISSFKLLGREWSNNTVHLIMSLPVSGAMVIGSKLLALLTQYIIGILVVGVTAFLIVSSSAPEIWQQIMIEPGAKTVFQLAVFLNILGLTNIIFFISSSFLSQLVGRLSRKHSGLISFIVFIAIFIIMGQIPHMDPVFTETLANRDLLDMNITGAMLLTAVVTLIPSALILGLSVLIYDHKMEL